MVVMAAAVGAPVRLDSFTSVQRAFSGGDRRPLTTVHGFKGGYRRPPVDPAEVQLCDPNAPVQPNDPCSCSSTPTSYPSPFLMVLNTLPTLLFYPIYLLNFSALSFTQYRYYWTGWLWVWLWLIQPGRPLRDNFNSVPVVSHARLLGLHPYSLLSIYINPTIPQAAT